MKKMVLAFIVMLTFCANCGFAQVNNFNSEIEKEEDNMIYDNPEEKPAFFGDVDAWLAKNIQYPLACEKAGVQGRVTVSLVVNKDGSISDVEAVRSPDDRLSREAERVVKTMPKWDPGRIDGKPVRARYLLPVMFRINE